MDYTHAEATALVRFHRDARRHKEQAVAAEDLHDCQHALDHATRCIAAIRASVEDDSLNAFDRLECIWQALRDYDGDGDE